MEKNGNCLLQSPFRIGWVVVITKLSEFVSKLSCYWNTDTQITFFFPEYFAEFPESLPHGMLWYFNWLLFMHNKVKLLCIQVIWHTTICVFGWTIGKSYCIHWEITNSRLACLIGTTWIKLGVHHAFINFRMSWNKRVITIVYALELCNFCTQKLCQFCAQNLCHFCTCKLCYFAIKMSLNHS